MTENLQMPSQMKNKGLLSLKIDTNQYINVCLKNGQPVLKPQSALYSFPCKSDFPHSYPQVWWMNAGKPRYASKIHKFFAAIGGAAGLYRKRTWKDGLHPLHSIGTSHDG